MKSLWDKIKYRAKWILFGIGFAVTIGISILTLGREQPMFGKPPKKPKRPEFKPVKDVDIPDVNLDLNTDFEDKPMNKYEESKAKPSEYSDALISNLNKEFD